MIPEGAFLSDGAGLSPLKSSAVPTAFTFLLVGIGVGRLQGLVWPGLLGVWFVVMRRRAVLETSSLVGCLVLLRIE